MSVSGSEVQPARPSRIEARRLPSTGQAARRVLAALADTERPGSLYKALTRLGGGWLRRGQLAALGWWRWRELFKMTWRSMGSMLRHNVKIREEYEINSHSPSFQSATSSAY